MPSRHVPAVIAAAVSGILVLGAGLATSSDDDTSETATDAGPDADRTTTTTERDNGATTTTEAEPDGTTSTTVGDPDPTTTTGPPTTSAPSTTVTVAPTTSPPTTAPTTTTTLAPSFMTLSRGPDPAAIAGCGAGTATASVRNDGQQVGNIAVTAASPLIQRPTVTQLRLAPGQEAVITVRSATNSASGGAAAVEILNTSNPQAFSFTVTVQPC